ncbi:MAG: 6-phosphogluconolactonase [Candidatus Malihini olakiniferum]
MQQIIYIASQKSQQIHVWQLASSWQLTLLQVVDAPGQVQPMVIAPNKKHLYVGIRPSFSAISYHINAQGLLTQVSSASLPSSPTHLSTDRQGRFLFSASYSGETLSVSPIDEQGIVDDPIQQLDGLSGCHSSNIDPENRMLWATCLKEDRIRLYDVSDNGELSVAAQVELRASKGSGPRHIDFHQNQRFAYCINELNSTIDVIELHSVEGRARTVQSLDAMPQGFADTRWAADIHLTPNNHFLYCSDRTASLLSIFQVSEDGSTLSLVGHQPTEMQPRGFNIDHSGEFVISAGQKSHHIQIYHIDQESGKLQPLARYAVGQGPVWVSVLALDSDA